MTQYNLSMVSKFVHAVYNITLRATGDADDVLELAINNNILTLLIIPN